MFGHRLVLIYPYMYVNHQQRQLLYVVFGERLIHELIYPYMYHIYTLSKAVLLEKGYLESSSSPFAALGMHTHTHTNNAHVYTHAKIRHM